MVSLGFLTQSEESAVISFPSLKELVTCILFLHIWIMFQQHGLSNIDNLGIATVLKSSVASSHQKHKCKKTEMLSSCPRVPTSVLKTLHIQEFQITVIAKAPDINGTVFLPTHTPSSFSHIEN